MYAIRSYYDQILAGLAGTVTPPAILAAGRDELAAMTEIHQGIYTAVGFQDNAAPVPAVTAIGPAMGDILLAPEAHTAVSAVTGTHLYASYNFV